MEVEKRGIDNETYIQLKLILYLLIVIIRVLMPMIKALVNLSTYVLGPFIKINFKFPMIEECFIVGLDNETHVENVALLIKK